MLPGISEEKKPEFVRNDDMCQLYFMLHVVCDPLFLPGREIMLKGAKQGAFWETESCFTGSSAFDEAGELQYLNDVRKELRQATRNT